MDAFDTGVHDAKAISLSALYIVYVAVLVRIAALLSGILRQLQAGRSSVAIRSSTSEVLRPRLPAFAMPRWVGRAMLRFAVFLGVFQLSFIAAGPTLMRSLLAYIDHPEEFGWDSASVRRHMLIVPPSTTLKHYANPSALTHHAGAVLWLVTMRLQFALPRGTLRERARHRLMGKAAMVAVALLTAGVVRVHMLNLHAYEDYRAMFPEDVPANTPALMRALITATLSVQGYFVLTAFLTWRAGAVKEVMCHRTWAIRHLCAGLWVALQRFSLPLTNMTLRIVLGRDLDGLEKAYIFYLAGVGAFIATVVGGELYLRLCATPSVLRIASGVAGAGKSAGARRHHD
mmetsp:Transcript_7235/g.19701  ORF Transcript_7235/g.19701 Transcript_7235/m.19701 type:complete len:344 (+) Transcript_7235:20-1051(+)